MALQAQRIALWRAADDRCRRREAYGRWSSPGETPADDVPPSCADSSISLWHPRQILTASVFGKPGLAAGVRVVAICAVARRARMRTLAVSISLALSSWQVTQSAFASVCVSTTFPSFAGAWQVSQLFVCERHVHELRHQLGRHPTGADRGTPRSWPWRKADSDAPSGDPILGIVAIQTKRGSRLGQMEPVLRRGFGARLVSEVAGVAAHVERGVTAALLGYIQPCLVATAGRDFLFLRPTRV